MTQIPLDASTSTTATEKVKTPEKEAGLATSMRHGHDSHPVRHAANFVLVPLAAAYYFLSQFLFMSHDWLGRGLCIVAWPFIAVPILVLIREIAGLRGETWVWGGLAWAASLLTMSLI